MTPMLPHRFCPICRAADGVTGGRSPTTAGPVAPEILADLAAASRILATNGVVDAFGHVTMRRADAPDRFLMARRVAPALVTPADILEFDLAGDCCDRRGQGVFLERFIHGAIYAARPDVQSVVHSHSPSVIPFGLVDRPMVATYHNAAFLASGVPVFDIARDFGATDMLVGSTEKGHALAQCLGNHAVALMRGHGSVAVGPSLKIATFRAVMTEVSARIQSAAIALGGNSSIGLSAEEGQLADAINIRMVDRPWDLWRSNLDVDF